MFKRPVLTIGLASLAIWALIIWGAITIAPSVEALFDGIVARIDHSIGYPGD